MIRRFRFVAVAGVAALTMADGAALASLCGFDQIAIFGINSVHVSRDATVIGDVVANGEGTAATLDEGAEVALDRNSTVTGNVSGHTLDLDGQSTIQGNATYVELFNGGTITGTQTTASPPYTDAPAFQPASPSSFDLVVGPNQTVVVGDVGDGNPLARRDFGTITIDRFGTLVFSGGGGFDAASIKTASTVGGTCPAPCRSIVFDAPTDLRVAGRIDTGRGSFVGPQDGSGIDASDIVIYGGGTNGGAGGPLGTPFAVNVGRESTVEANIYAPFGTVEIDRDSTVTGALLGLDVELQVGADLIMLKSAFGNEIPTAIAQEVLTDGANTLEITLEGSDPEGADLSFSIEAGPSKGTLGTITPITPAPVDQCSQSGAACSVDSDCPFFAGGETCETVQPPITQATVTYTPTAANCVTEAGVTTCPEDFFTFGVSDDCGAKGTAIVSINGGTAEDDNPDGPDSIDAAGQEIAAVPDEVVTITLTADAPGVANVAFRVETLPAGDLKDSNNVPVVAGIDLPSPVLTYTAPSTPGTDGFTFSARDATTSGSPCGPPSCDTAAINIGTTPRPKLAPDQTVANGNAVNTNLNTSVRVTLRANAGGTGSGPQPSAAGTVSLTYGDNGPPLTPWQLHRMAARQGVAADADGSRRGTRVGTLGPTALGVDQGWEQFGWCDMATSPTCSGALVDLVNEVEVDKSPFNFAVSEASCLRVTDTLAKGDHWRVQSLNTSGGIDWTDFTSEVDQSQVGTTSDPNVAFGDLSYSHGEFDLNGDCVDLSGAPVPCSYSIKLTTIPPDSFSWGTAGFIRVDTGACVDIVWTVVDLPAGGTLTNLDGSAVLAGDTYLAQPTLNFTPTINVSGTTSFTYQVDQGGTLGTAVTDTALVEIVVSALDQCTPVGREPGCAPGGPQQGQAQAVEAEPTFSGPRRGLTLAVEGPGGSVSTTPVELSAGRVLRSLHCSSGAECNKAFPAGSQVTLFARPDGEHFEFLRWEGDCRGSEPILTVNLDVATRCTAVFGKSQID